MSIRSVVIAGAGQAGAQCALSLRQWGFDGVVDLVGDEAFPPYERPPLSKAFLKGDVAEDALHLKPADWYAANGVGLRTGSVVDSIDREVGIVRLRDRSELPFDALVLATGSRPRPLPIPGANLDGLHEVRTIRDTRALAAALARGGRLAVVGAGYVGLEVAAAARSLGLEVTVVEAMDRVLARVAGPVVSRFYEDEHRRHGVEVRLGARLAAFDGNARVEALRFDDGSTLEASAVVVGIGIVPNQELAAAAGLDVDDGVVVDRDARTSDPRIFAVGDVARRPLVHYGRTGRLESVHNAIEQGKIAAAAILGRDRPAEDVPWFWSDQYGLKLQIAGLGLGHDRIVVRGNPDERRFAAFYLKDGTLLAADAIASPAEFMAAKLMIARGARPDPDRLADPGVAMKDLVHADRA